MRPFCSLQLFDISPGFNPKLVDREEVAGDSSFNRQTLVFSKCSVTNTVGATNTSDLLREKSGLAERREGGQRVKKVKDKSAFLSTCLECLPSHLPPGHSFSLLHNGHAMNFTIRLASNWK